MELHYQLTREETVRWYTLMTTTWRVVGLDRRLIASIGAGAIVASLVVGWLVGGVLVSLGGGLFVATGLAAMAAFPHYIFPRAAGPGWGPGANPVGSFARRLRFDLVVSDEGVELSFKRPFGLGGAARRFRRWSFARFAVFGPDDLFVSFGMSPVLVPERACATRTDFEQVIVWARAGVSMAAQHEAGEPDLQPLSRGAAIRDNLKRQGIILLAAVPIAGAIIVVIALRN